MDKENLLQTLFLSVGCVYLSDLHTGMHYPTIIKILEHIPPDRFSIDDWNTAISYICHQEASYLDSETARKILLEKLEILSHG